MQELQSRNDIVITDADKGGAVVILDVKDYIKEAERQLKGCVRYIFATLFFKSKLEYLSNWERCFLFHFKSFFHSQENQILEFYILKFHDGIKCLSTKQEIHFTEPLWR